MNIDEDKWNKLTEEEKEKINKKLNKILQEEIDKEFLSQVRRSMPTIIAEDIVGVSPFEGPNFEWGKL